MHASQKLFQRRRGSLTVEFAITVPILFLMVFAAIEFCGMNVMRHSVDNAAYEAARRGIVPGATATDVRNVANDIMATVGARNVQVVVDPSTIGSATPEITVTVTVPVANNGWIAPIFFSSADVLRGQCHLLREEL